MIWDHFERLAYFLSCEPNEPISYFYWFIDSFRLDNQLHQWGSIRHKYNGRWQYLSRMKNVWFKKLFLKFWKTQQASIRDQWRHLQLMESHRNLMRKDVSLFFSFRFVHEFAVKSKKKNGSMATKLGDAMRANIRRCLNAFALSRLHCFIKHYLRLVL